MSTLTDVHGQLVDAAVTIANQMDPPQGLVYNGELFFNADNRSSGSTFSLGVVEGLLDSLGESERARVFGQLRVMARQAFAQALREHSEMLAGLILAEARQGHNYFDRFQ